MTDQYDVVVVGGGSAGLPAATALARSRRSVLVIDGGEPRNAPAAHMHNYLGREGTPPRELLASGRAELEAYGGEVVLAQVDAARAGDSSDPVGFRIEFGGRAVTARRVILATGSTDELPAVDGLAGRWGRDVLHCPYCHGYEVRDRAIGVIASAPSFAVHHAVMFRQLSDDVVVFRHDAGDFSDDERAQLGAWGIAVIDGVIEEVLTANDALTGVRLRGGDVVAREALTVFSRPLARAGVASMLGVDTEDVVMNDHFVGTRIAVDMTGATGVPGVFAAGNVTNPMATVLVSAASGMQTGAAVNADLIAEDTRARRSAAATT